MSSELVCNFCGKQFSSETLLNDHNRDVHTQVESPCNLCDKSFRSKKKLRYHITSTHAEKEAFQCDIKSDGIQCIYYATTNSNLRAHKKRVHDEKPTNANLAKHVCDLCDFRTNTKFNLDRHSEKCKTLDPSPNFITKWKVLEDCFGIGCTLKIHIIGTHLLDVLRDTGKTLHDESDEPVE